MTKTHYIYMNGAYGCLPDNCGTADTIDEAITILSDGLDLEDWQRENLEAYQYTDCTPDQGADYCEIVECRCDTPEVHDDN